MKNEIKRKNELPFWGFEFSVLIEDARGLCVFFIMETVFLMFQRKHEERFYADCSVESVSCDSFEVKLCLRGFEKL